MHGGRNVRKVSGHYWWHIECIRGVSRKPVTKWGRNVGQQRVRGHFQFCTKGEGIFVDQKVSAKNNFDHYVEN